MQIIAKENENYYPDRSYKNSAKNGTIKTIGRSLVNREKGFHGPEKLKQVRKNAHKGKSYVNALLSTRWTTRGAEIVITRQPNTTDEAYALAKKLQVELTNELVKFNRFKDGYDGFVEWFGEKEQILKDNGFHNLKG